MIAGGIAQMLVVIPALGFMLGSFVGSVVGAFTYDGVYSATLSFCADTGFTLFGLVKQDYKLPKSVLKSLGVKTVEVKKCHLQKATIRRMKTLKLTQKKMQPKAVEVIPLRRGVIGVSQIGYISNWQFGLQIGYSSIAEFLSNGGRVMSDNSSIKAVSSKDVFRQ